MSLRSLVYPVALIIAGALCALYYAKLTVPVDAEFIAAMHNAIAEGVAESPYRYRLLSVWFVELIRLGGMTVVEAYIIAHAVAFPAMLIACWRWFAAWMNPDRAASAAVGLAVYVPLGLLNWSLSLYTALEVLSVAAACLLLVQTPTTRVRGAYTALMLVSIMNRETGALLAVLWMFWHWGERREMRFGLALALAAVVEYLLIRRALGEMGHNYTVLNMWGLMWSEWGTETILYNLLIVPVWLGAAVGWRRAEARLRRLAVGAVAIAASAAAFGMWHEVRLQFPALVLLLPLVFGENERPGRA